MKQNITKYTLFEYLSGRCNPLEKNRVAEWVTDSTNSETFYEWLLEYEMRYPQFNPNQQRAFLALEKMLENAQSEASDEDQPDEGQRDENTRYRPLIRKVLAVAASILMAVGTGWWYRDPLLYKTYKTGYGQVTDIYLEDGSKVVLNANSALKVPRFGFSNKVREVYLQGEGDFSVSHTVDQKRFVVKTSEKFQVEVLGTQFSVFARPRATKVALKSGSVRIDYDQKEKRSEVMMEPGDIAVLDKKGALQLEKHQDTQVMAAWKEQRYVFDATPVTEIVEVVKESFGLHVGVIDAETGKRTITGNFRTKNGDELLKTISEVLDLKMTTSGDSILLSAN